MPADITKYGVSGLKGLKGVNTNVDPEYQEALQYRNRTLRGSSGPTLRDTFSTFSYGEGSPMNNWGTSGYDNEIMNTPLTTEQIQDTRYENQPWYDTLANGVGKMLGTAATTFASSLFGLPYGLIRTGIAAAQGEDNPWSNLWDNEITQGLSEVEDWMEKNMTNYKSTEQQNAPWYSLANLGSMNFWADDVIKNAGFTLGAAASMAVGSGALGLLSKSMGMVNKASTGTKVANGFLSALFSATGEGMIEAKHGVDERNKLEIQRLNDALAPERQALQMELNEIEQDYALTGDYEAYKRRLNDYTVKKDYFDQKEAAGMEEIERTGKDMGNKILMGNQALLTAGNLIQFGKLMTKSFNNARHAAETASKSAKPSMWRDGFTATRKSAGDITKGYAMSSKNLGRLRAGTKGLLVEGSEEMNQQWIQSGAGAAYNEKDVNDYWKAKLDSKAYRDTTEGLYTLGSAISQGFNESWGDVNQWEQFVIGGLTGMAGSYSPTKLFNQDKTKSRWDPRRYGSWEGGMVNEIKDFNKQYNQYAENIDDLNKILDQEDFGARVQNLIAHSFLERRKEQAAKDNDMKTWKDEDDKQTVHDIQAFYRAGKIDDLRALYDEMSQNMSDADVESIKKRTTKVTTAEEDRENYYAALDEEIEKKQQDVNDLYNQLESVQADYESGNIAEDEAQSQTRSLTSKISNAEAEVGRLTEERKKKDTSEGYNGSPKYEGPYVDINGNQIKSNDDIREEIKGNTGKLQRRLEQYLEGIQEVNDRTNGQLSKDQEDNLAYLHFLSRRKGERFNDIMKDVRKQIPSTFLIKTNQTPEQLTQQYASSDLAFSKNDTTPEGYVEVNTSMMNDNNFGAFFADTVLWGNNIHPAYTREDLLEELEAREEDKKYSKEEQEKRREERAKKQNEKAEKKDRDAKMARDEQRERNLKLIKDAIINNALYKEGKTLVQALKENQFDKLLDTIYQALALRNEEAEYENTLDEYMRNPQKVDQDKKKAEKTNTEKAKKEAENKATTADMMDMDDDDLAAAVLGGRKGKNKNGKKAQKAMGLKNSRSKAEKSLDEAVASGKITREAADDALKLLDNQIGKMLQEDDEAEFGNLKDVASKVFDTSTEAMDDAEALWDDELRDAINNGAVEWEEVEDDFQARLDSAKDAIRLISDPVEKELEEYDQSIDMGKQFKDLETEEQKGTKELDEKISQAADESKAAENPDSTSNRNGSEKSDDLKAVKPRRTAKTKTSNKKKAQPEPEELEEPEVKLNTAGDDAALEEDKAGGEKGNTGTQGNKVWGLWHTGVSEVSQYGNEPWTANPSDPNAELQQKRYDAIRKKLMDGAYTARKLGKVTPGMKIGFKIFQDVNDAAAGDFVVFITDEKGNIIGDLPSEDARFNRERFPISMDDLYKALHEEWDDTTDEEKKAGMQSQYTTVVDEVLVGKVRYQEDRQTVEQLTSGSDTKVKPLFAIKRPVDKKTGKDASSGTVELRMDTGTDNQGRPLVSGVHMPLTGKAGQPYVLIQTPGVYTDSPIKYLAVPIKTMTVGEANANNTIYSKVLKTILDNIKQGRISDFDARRILEALLSVHSVHVNLDEGSNTKKELGIRIRSFNRESGITKGVPYTIYEGKREDMDVNAIMEALANVQINVSSQLINGKGKEGIAKYLTLNGEPVNYNDMLAEVAHTNAAEPQAVNDWFTIKPLQQKGDDLQMVENSVKMESWADVEVDDPDVTSSTGETWTVKISEGYTVYDAEGRQVTTKTHGKNKAQEAAILAAEKFGEVNSKPSNRPYAVLINGKSYIFNPANRTFKTYAQAEKDPKYVYEKVKDGKKLTEQEKYTIMKDALERQMLELDELWEERRRQQEASTPQQIGQDMATHLREMGVDVELVDDANKAAEGIEDAQLLAIGEKGARSLDTAEEATTRMDNLSVANEMEKAGKDALTIKIATGWERGADGKWRYEVPDVKLHGGILYNAIHDKKIVSLADLLGKYKYETKEGKQLLSAYPKLKDAKVIFTYNKVSEDSLGEYNSLTNTIRIYYNNLGVRGKQYIDEYAINEIELTLVHEIQHAIQGLEGFAEGGSTGIAVELINNWNNLKNEKASEFEALKKDISNIARKVVQASPELQELRNERDNPNTTEEEKESLNNRIKELLLQNKEVADLFLRINRFIRLNNTISKVGFNWEEGTFYDKESIAYAIYRRLAGEVESRTVSKRHFLTEEERRNSLLTEEMYKDVAKEDLVFLKGPRIANINMLKVNGKILGFEYSGKLYLQKDALNPSLPMHEYTHLWDKVIKTVDPRLWNRGKELMKSEAADLWKQIADDENYGKRWEKEGKTAEELEDLIASEVHARFTGNGFEEYVKKHPNNSFAKLREWLLNAFKKLAKTLGMSNEQVNKLTLADWNNMTVRDFMEKSITMNTLQETVSEDKRKDHTEEVRAAIAKMEEESKHFKLVKWDDKQKKYVEDREGNYYRDDRDGSIHARVSNVNDADIEVIEANKEAKFGIVNPQLKKASTGAGNVVDRFVREFFRNGDLFEGLDLNTTEGSNTAIERMKDIAGDSSFQNISTDDILRLGMALHEFKQSLGADWKINSSGIVASGIVSFDGDTMVKVAGTIDLLAYNEKTGQYDIIDMKTHLAPLFRNNGDLRTDAKTLAKLAHWRAQQTLYKQFLETKYKEDGVKSVGLRIMPFKVDYSTKFAETDYQVGDDGVLRDKGIVVDINPKYDGRLVRLAPKENTKYDVGQLSESIKRLLPRKKVPIIKQPEDPEVEVKGKLIDIRDSVPEGRSLKEFVSAKYKDNDDVKKLVDILEANRGEANPVMMTQASQKLLLAAINQTALDKAIQEAKAAAEKLKVDIPEQEEMDLDTFIEELEASGSYSDDVIEFIQELPEDLQKKVMNSNLATIISAMIDQDASDEDIQQAIRNYDLNARHKKAVKEYTLIDLPKELRWMRENLPQLSSERRLHIIKGLIRCSDGTESFGQVNASMILIGTQAAEGTVYHEAFHAVVQFLLTDDEINSLFEAAKKRWGDLSAAALEERMADEFENYMKGLDPEDNRIKRFFKELWRAIRAWLGNKSYMENLYRNINSGVYAARDVRDDRNNALSRIRSEQRDITKDYSFLTEDEKERVKEAGVSKETWNQLTKKQQEYMLHCVV